VATYRLVMNTRPPPVQVASANGNWRPGHLIVNPTKGAAETQRGGMCSWLASHGELTLVGVEGIGS
jgi:hypothetical protein